MNIAAAVAAIYAASWAHGEEMMEDPYYNLCRIWMDYYQRMADLMLLASRMGDHNPPLETPVDETWDEIERRGRG
jgi:hypothetical protein